MTIQDILSIAIASLLILVVAHITVVWVVKTLYPPPHPEPIPAPIPTVSFTSPPVTEQQQHVSIPTYEAPVPTEASREEGERRGPPPAESTSIRGGSGNTVSNT